MSTATAFALRDRPEAVTAVDLGGPTDGWANVEVPGCWTMQGFDRRGRDELQTDRACVGGKQQRIAADVLHGAAQVGRQGGLTGVETG